MRKTPPISIDKITLAFLFAFQAIQYTRAGIMLDNSLLGWLGGAIRGIMIVLKVDGRFRLLAVPSYSVSARPSASRE